MPNIPLAGGAVLRALLLSALMVGVADAEAKGKIRIGSNVGTSSKSTSAKTSGDKDEEARKDSGGLRPQLNLRQSSSGTNSPTGTSLTNGLVPIQGAGQATSDDPEETARRTASIERAQTEKAVARRAAAEKAEAERAAAEKAEAERAAQKAAEDHAEAARQRAALEKKKREEAAMAAEADRVLERAKNDYPVLRTPEGDAVLQTILARQQVLASRGVYPSIAMVEAIADHQHVLVPRARTGAASLQAGTAAVPAKTPTYAGCRWVTPTQWACDR